MGLNPRQGGASIITAESDDCGECFAINEIHFLYDIMLGRRVLDNTHRVYPYITFSKLANEVDGVSNSARNRPIQSTKESGLKTFSYVLLQRLVHAYLSSHVAKCDISES